MTGPGEGHQFCLSGCPLPCVVSGNEHLSEERGLMCCGDRIQFMGPEANATGGLLTHTGGRKWEGFQEEGDMRIPVADSC